ncbi:hypothetical protein B0H14DRAFT_2578751 [Mycena olivaceomarginata]|nr:hypothetical protein B0H14DRAFT_2578751 [Mycena olivaceomarginata]
MITAGIFNASTTGGTIAKGIARGARAKGRERMARLRAKSAEEQRARHREAQARYREKNREWIAHKARRAAAKKNAEAGKQTKSRPKARHYWSCDETANDTRGTSPRPAPLLYLRKPPWMFSLEDRTCAWIIGGSKTPDTIASRLFVATRSRLVTARRKGAFPFHLVGQGHVVGVFDNWVEAKASLAGYPDSSNQGCDTEEECIEVWQRLCVLGVHPHPTDPAFFAPPAESASAFVNTSPRKSRAIVSPSGKREASLVKGERTDVVKREETPRRTPATPELLANLKKYCRPIKPLTPTPSPKKAAHLSAPSSDAPRVNYAIRGDGIISSSAVRSEQRYLELQHRGEEPDLLITRSFAQAAFFALDDEDVEGDA